MAVRFEFPVDLQQGGAESQNKNVKELRPTVLGDPLCHQSEKRRAVHFCGLPEVQSQVQLQEGRAQVRFGTALDLACTSPREEKVMVNQT